MFDNANAGQGQIGHKMVRKQFLEVPFDEMP
jgi:hypothetical protein